MKDVAGNELKIGDTVAITQSHYKVLKIGEVVRFTDKRIIVKRKFMWQNKEVSREKICREDQVVKVYKDGPMF